MLVLGTPFFSLLSPLSSLYLSHPPIRLCLVMMATPTDCIYFLIELACAQTSFRCVCKNEQSEQLLIDMGRHRRLIGYRSKHIRSYQISNRLSLISIDRRSNEKKEKKKKRKIFDDVARTTDVSNGLEVRVGRGRSVCCLYQKDGKATRTIRQILPSTINPKEKRRKRKKNVFRDQFVFFFYS